DGLDEVPSTEQQQRIVELARSMLQTDQQIQVVITARDYIRGPWINWLPRLGIEEFSQEQVQTLVTNWLDGDLQAVAEFYGELDAASDLKQLMRIPLLGTLILGVYRHV